MDGTRWRYRGMASSSVTGLRAGPNFRYRPIRGGFIQIEQLCAESFG